MTSGEDPRAIRPPAPLRVGDRAPDFTLPAGDREGTVSLGEYRGQPLLLGLFRGIYCPFCRRGIARMGQAAARLASEGIGALAVVATTPDNARTYFRFRPPRVPVAADPDFVTHRLYGVPAPRRSDIEAPFSAARVNPTGELPAALPIREASAELSRLDGYERTPRDVEDAAWPYLQLLGQFLVDPGGIIRWVNVENAQGFAGHGRFPADEELLTAVRSAPR
jgi:peroxiredoxin